MTIQGWLIVAGVFSVSLVIALEVLMQRYYDQPMIDVESRHAPSATKASGEDILGRLRACETRPLTTMTEECRAVVRDPAAWVELWKTLQDVRVEIERLRDAIRRLAAQDATISACDGNVTVTMDGTLTAEERKAVEEARTVLMTEGASWGDSREKHAETLRSLLQRLGGTNG